MIKKSFSQFRANFKKDVAFRIISIGLICLLFFPWLLTRTWGLFHFNEGSAWVGDAIGGITGPISGFLGAVLVYLALKEQIKANRIITDQFKEQKKDDRSNKIIGIVTEQLKLMREDIKDLEFTVKNNSNQSYPVRGKAAITKILEAYPIGHIEDNRKILYSNLSLNEIRYFISNISYLLNLVYQSDIHKEDKENLLRMIAEIYNTKLAVALMENEYKRSSRQDTCHCGLNHGIPNALYSVNDSVLKFLEVNKIIY
jgi:hypothetical protein